MHTSMGFDVYSCMHKICMSNLHLVLSDTFNFILINVNRMTLLQAVIVRTVRLVSASLLVTELVQSSPTMASSVTKIIVVAAVLVGIIVPCMAVMR